jgi:hypothetical protein
VRERDRLGEIFVQSEHASDRPRDVRHFERMGEPRPQMIAGAV